MIRIGRPINGIVINPSEYLLDENGEVITFADEKEAKAFLSRHGYSEADMEFLVFEYMPEV